MHTYLCIFIKYGIYRAYLFLVVPSGYPRIVESPSLKAVEKDRSATMVCSAGGNPDPTITWLKDFIPVDVTDPRLTILPTGAN